MKEKGSKIKRMALLWGFFLMVIPALSFAQQYPTKPINLVVTFAAGGTTDLSIRPLSIAAEKILGQPIAISNNGAGAGSVALALIAKEKPDGYRLAGCSSSGLVRIPQFRTVPYKMDDFVPVMHYAGSLSGLVVRADSPWKTLKELVEYARKNPRKVNYSSYGVGSPHHLAMEYVAKQEGIQWVHVPYPGSAPALTALLGGHVSACSGSSEWIPHVKEGTVRLLGTHSEKRIKTFPEVPTFRELGYDYINETVFLVAAPKGTPSSVVNKLDDAFHKAMEDPAFIKTMDMLELVITYRNSEDTRKYLEDAYVRIGKMIHELKLPKEDEKK